MPAAQKKSRILGALVCGFIVAFIVFVLYGLIFNDVYEPGAMPEPPPIPASQS